MATLTIQPAESVSQDCFIRSTAPTSPSDGGLLHVGTLFIFDNSLYQRALVRMSLASLPAMSVVTAATFTLTFDGGAPIPGATYTAKRLTRATWTEGATWNAYDGASNWTTAGGDFTNTNAATFEYASGTTLVFNVLAMLNDARDAGLDYLDLILIGPEVPGSSNYVVGLSSAETDEADRPKLVLTLRGPGCVSVALTEPWRLTAALSGCSVRRIPSMGYDIVDQGDLPRSTATFTTAAGAAHDPDVVSCIVVAPDGTETTYVYDTDDEIVRDALGVYHIDIDVDQSGRWYHRWVATGFGQAAEQQWFEARAAV